jgi:hypothetical protein
MPVLKGCLGLPAAVRVVGEQRKVSGRTWDALPVYGVNDNVRCIWHPRNDLKRGSTKLVFGR